MLLKGTVTLRQDLGKVNGICSLAFVNGMPQGSVLTPHLLSLYNLVICNCTYLIVKPIIWFYKAVHYRLKKHFMNCSLCFKFYILSS